MTAYPCKWLAIAGASIESSISNPEQSFTGASNAPQGATCVLLFLECRDGDVFDGFLSSSTEAGRSAIVPARLPLGDAVTLRSVSGRPRGSHAVRVAISGISGLCQAHGAQECLLKADAALLYTKSVGARGLASNMKPFVPKMLPIELDWERLIRHIGPANRALANFDGGTPGRRRI